MLPRYARQVRIAGFGEDGQRRLGQARVFVLGAGGLGSPVLTYLAAAGLGEVVFADHDRVEPSNLDRQVLYTEADLGRPKAGAALDRVRALNPAVHWQAHDEPFGSEGCEQWLDGIAVAFDCADNHVARTALATAAHRRSIPVVHGAVAGFEGTVGVLASRTGACYACVHPEPTPGPSQPVLGAVAGAVGALMACEGIKQLLGIGPDRTGQLLLLDLERGTFDWVRVARRPGCVVCG